MLLKSTSDNIPRLLPPRQRESGLLLNYIHEAMNSESHSSLPLMVDWGGLVGRADTGKLSGTKPYTCPLPCPPTHTHTAVHTSRRACLSTSDWCS